MNNDTIFQNHFINCAHNGVFPGLNNKKLKEFGQNLKFYSGVPEIFEKSKKHFSFHRFYDIILVSIDFALHRLHPKTATKEKGTRTGLSRVVL